LVDYTNTNFQGSSSASTAENRNDQMFQRIKNVSDKYYIRQTDNEEFYSIVDLSFHSNYIFSNSPVNSCCSNSEYGIEKSVLSDSETSNNYDSCSSSDGTNLIRQNKRGIRNR